MTNEEKEITKALKILNKDRERLLKLVESMSGILKEHQKRIEKLEYCSVHLIRKMKKVKGGKK
jgi:prefoldin subunit 5